LVLSASFSFSFFFSLSALHLIHPSFWGKKKTEGRCPDTNFGSCYGHFGHVIKDTKRPCIIRHYFIFIFFGHHQTLLVEKLGSQGGEKKKRSRQYLSTVNNKEPLLI
jgi:hypothetical protein